MTPVHADRALALRIESSNVRDALGYVSTASASGVYPDAEAFRLAGGVATWFGEPSVLNGSYGIGLSAPVELEEVVALETFYRERGSVPTIDVCPFVDASLLRWLAERGFLADSFLSVLVRPAGGEDTLPSPGTGVAVLSGDEVDPGVWARLAARGFTEDHPTADDARVATASAARTDVLRQIALVDAAPSGTGMLTIDGTIAHLNGDSTLPTARGRGAQQALIAHRLRQAADAGAELVFAETNPGGPSQRNMERLGFRVAYTRVTLLAPVAS